MSFNNLIAGSAKDPLNRPFVRRSEMKWDATDDIFQALLKWPISCLSGNLVCAFETESEESDIKEEPGSCYLVTKLCFLDHTYSF